MLNLQRAGNSSTGSDLRLSSALQVAADEFYRNFRLDICYDCRGRDETLRLVTKVQHAA